MAASRFCRPTVFFVVSSLGALLHPTSARACDFAGPTAHTIDPALQATDHVPPVWPSPPRAQGVQRGRGPQQNGCGGTASSCDDIGIITITTGATDDTTAPGRVGYRLSQASGAHARGSLPTSRRRRAEPGWLADAGVERRGHGQPRLVLLHARHRGDRCCRQRERAAGSRHRGRKTGRGLRARRSPSSVGLGGLGLTVGPRARGHPAAAGAQTRHAPWPRTADPATS